MNSFKNILSYLILIICTPVLWAQSSTDCPTTTAVSPSVTQSVCEGETINPLTAAITPAPVATSATDWLDMSGNGYDAVLQNGVGYDAANGGVLTFDGVDDYALGDATPTINTALAFTMEYWVYFNSSYTNFPHPVVTKVGGQSDAFVTAFVPSSQFSGYGTFTFGHRTNARMKINDALPINTWHHILISYNGNGFSAPSNFNIYINNVERTILNANAFATSSNINGFFYDGGVSRLGNAKLPMYNLYLNKKFTQAEVTQNFNFYKNRFGMGAQEASSIVSGATVNLDSGNPLSYNNGSYTPSYQWYYNTTNSNQIEGATLIEGATSASYAPPSTAADLGSRWYFCVGYATDNGCGQTNASQSLASNTTPIAINAKPNLIITNPDEVFMPSTVNLTDSAVTAGSDEGTLSYWTDAGATVALNSPAAVALSGTYYIKLTNAGGCDVIKPVTVTISELTTLIITDPAAVCTPSTVDLTDPAVTAGSNEGTLTYWEDAGATIALDSPAAISQSGTYYIKLIDVNNYISIKPVTVTVNPLPLAATISSNALVCAGLDAVFTITGTAGNQVSYTGAASGTATIGGDGTVDITIYGITTNTTLNLTGVSDGNCLLTLTDVNETVAVDTAPVLIITDPAEVYLPSTVNLTDPAVTAGSDAGTLSYWTDAGATVALSSPSAITTSGTYYIKLTTTGACSSIQPVTVTISERPPIVTTPLVTLSDDIVAPGRMAVDTDDNVYVTDAIQHSIIKYDALGNYNTSIATDFKPISIAINKNNHLFVGDQITGNIYKLAPNGTKTIFYSGTTLPNSMVFGLNDILYIVDSQLKRVIGLDASGTVVTDFTSENFVFPTGIAFDKQNKHFIVSEHGGIGEDVQYCYSGNWQVSSWGPVTTVYILDFDGTLISQFGCFGTKDGEFQRIQGVSMGTCGNIYAVDPYLGRVSVFDDSGNYLTKFGLQGNGAGELNLPIDIAFTSDNSAFVSSMNKGAIDIFSITDTLPTATITSEDQTICADAKGIIEIEFTGNGPWSFTYTVDKLNPIAINADESPFSFEVNGAGLYEISALTDSNNVAGTCFTGATNITVIDLPTATILTSDFSKCQDENLGVDVQFTGTAPWIFTYTIDGLNPTELTSTENTYTIPVEQSGVYEIIALSDASCTGESFTGAPNITVHELPTATLMNEKRYEYISEGESRDFIIAFTGMAPYTFTYSKDGEEEFTISTSDNPFTLALSEKGTYEILNMSDAFCYNPAWQCYFDIFINDIELPTATIITENIDMCAGATDAIAIEFTGTVPWTFSYTIDGGNPSEISTSNNPYLLSVSASGVYELSAVSDANGEGTFTGLATVSVFEQPVVDLATAIALCSGETIVLNAGTFESYLWNNGTTAQTLEVSTAGIYSVTVTDSNGCTATASTTVTIEPVPFVDLGPDINLCEGDPVYVLDAGNFETYLWSDGSTGRTLEVSANGIYSVTVTNTSGCTASDSVSVSVLSLPDAYFYYDTDALDVQFVNNSLNADFHYWDFGDGTSSTEENPMHHYASKGTYTVTYTALNNYCGSSEFTETVNVGGKSTSEIIDIYPNPSTGSFTILISPDEPLLGTINISIHSTSGQYLYSGTYNPNMVTSYNGNYYIDVHIDSYTKGIYIVYIDAGNFVGQDKLILKD